MIRAGCFLCRVSASIAPGTAGTLCSFGVALPYRRARVPDRLSKRLDFNDDLLKANQVGKILFLQGQTFIPNGDRLLSDKGIFPVSKLDLHGFLVDRLKEARAKLAMHACGSPYNCIHLLFQFRHCRRSGIRHTG